MNNFWKISHVSKATIKNNRLRRIKVKTTRSESSEGEEEVEERKYQVFFFVNFKNKL